MDDILLRPPAAPAGAPYLLGIVTQASPLRVRLNGDSVALPYTPTCLDSAKPLRVGDRVVGTLLNGRLCVLGGVSGGGPKQVLDDMYRVVFDEYGVWTSDFTDDAVSGWQLINGAGLKNADGTDRGSTVIPLPELLVGDVLEVTTSLRVSSSAASIAYAAAWYLNNPWTKLAQSTVNGLVSTQASQPVLRLRVTQARAAGETAACALLHQTSAVTPTVDAGSSTERPSWVHARVLRKGGL